MSRKARHNKEVRARVLQAAGVDFRRDGFDRARIDDLMARAGLTRGAFYAHFPSKGALFHAVIAEEDLLLRLLRGRSDAVQGAMLAGLSYILARLLAPEHLEAVVEGWTLAALLRDAGRGDAEARETYETARGQVIAEMGRGLNGAGDPRLDAALSLAVGAVATASACHSEVAREAVLAAAKGQVLRLVAEVAATGTGRTMSPPGRAEEPERGGVERAGQRPLS